MIHFITACSVGCLAWTLSEYMLHRYVGHKKGGKNNISREHQAHHRDPYHFTPTRRKLLTAGLLAKILVPLSIFAVGWGTGIAFSIGFFGRYLSYEILHRRIHTHAPKPNVYSRWLRTHHLYHHFTDARFNHGVTSPIWDIVFRTYRSPGVIRVPRALCMDWLKDGPSDDIRPELQVHYQLR